MIFEDRLAKADVVAVARWDESSGVAAYTNRDERRVYVRRKLRVSRLLLGTLPQRPVLLVRGGAYFDPRTKSYIVDDEDPVGLPTEPGEYVVLLKHLAGKDYELVDGIRGVLGGPTDGSGQATTRIWTRRADVLPAGSVIPARTPSPDVTAASLSLDQLRELIHQLSTGMPRDLPSTEIPSSRLVTRAKAVDRKTIVERLGASADRVVIEHTGRAFFDEHLSRAPNSHRAQRPRSMSEAPDPEGRWYGIGFSYRLSAFGRVSESAAASLVIGLDGSVLSGADRLPDCDVQPGACTFNVDEAAAKRIAQGHGLEQGTLPWRMALYWEPSCRAFVWSIMNYLSKQESKIIHVTTGSGQVCGEQFVTTISAGGPAPELEPPELTPPKP
jgi:hypothetical protein